MSTIRVAVDIEADDLPPGFRIQDVSEMLFSYVHGTLVPVLGIKAAGQLDSQPYEPPHAHVEGCEHCNAYMYDERY